MASQSASEAKKQNIEKMGERLGSFYSALWQEVVQVHQRWREYVELFGDTPGRITLLNEAAPLFFRTVQDALWEATLLHIARLTDPPQSMGRADKSNLSIRTIPDLIDDEKVKQDAVALLSDAMKSSEFCRDWRNRLLAYRDLDLVLDQPVTPLTPASRAMVKDALKAITALMNHVQARYLDSETAYDIGASPRGAISLLYI